MANLQEVWLRMQKTKKKQKEIRSAYKDALAGSADYAKIVEDLKTLREKKKKIEMDVRGDFSSEFRELDNLKADTETDAEMLSDLALNTFVKGETVQVTDEYENKYEPVFVVKFKRVY
ncbi:hypothetical protein KKD80_02345 [Patescibacteria group bacterium]|nr:hypothetical protein [Patescibacteria group bacterium]